MKKIIILVMLFLISQYSFSQMATTPADTTQPRLGISLPLPKIYMPYNPIKNSLMLPDTKNYRYISSNYFWNKDQTQGALYGAVQILMNIFNDRSGYRYAPSHPNVNP